MRPDGPTIGRFERQHMNTLEAGHAPAQLGPAEQRKVLQQLNRLLESHQFKNSRRYPALLRFIVEETLEGRGEFLKERLLGVRVFDRPADYDTAADPIVRVTIAEIRKRIAQYYHDEEHDAEIRIELLPGRYAPEFRARRDTHGVHEHAENDKAAVSAVSVTTPEAPAQLETGMPALAPAAMATAPAASAPVRARASFARWYLLSSMLSLLLTAAVVYRWTRPSAVEQLWSPILASSRPLLFCLPTDAGFTEAVVSSAPTPSLEVVTRPGPATQLAKDSGATFLDHESLGENVVYSDMLATLNVANIMAAHHREYAVRLTTMTTLDDLRHGPAVLIGGLDNQWTVRALNPLRFHFSGSDNDGWSIYDAKNPTDRSWTLDLKQKYAAVTRDYAIVARIHNEQTGQPQMIVAGIGMSGTAAGGEFVANEKSLEDLRAKLGSDFKDRDFEVVLATDVVNGIAGSPKVLAVASR